MKDIDLMVMIPTYNRKEALLNTLILLEKQSVSRFEVTIIDNNSSFNVNEIFYKLTDEFRKRIHVIRNLHNIGMAGNIASLYGNMKKKWNWLLSDDDQPEKNAVETILNDIENLADRKTAVIQYTHVEQSKDYNNNSFMLCGILKYIEFFYEMWKKKAASFLEIEGMLIYLSNKVVNLEVIEPYICYAYQCGNTMIPQCIPILKALDQGYNMIQSNKIIVKYNDRSKTSWNYRDVAFGIISIKNIEFDSLDRKKVYRLMGLLMLKADFCLRQYYLNGKNDPVFLIELYESVYKYILRTEDKDNFRKVISLAKEGEEMEFIKRKYHISEK